MEELNRNKAHSKIDISVKSQHNASNNHAISQKNMLIDVLLHKAHHDAHQSLVLASSSNWHAELWGFHREHQICIIIHIYLTQPCPCS